MATQVQNRRGTTAEHSTFTGAVGELTVDTTKDTVVVHDGAVAGGRPLLREDQSNLPTSAPTTGIYNASGSLAISTGGSGRLFVDASGRVGIGTNTPGYPLEVWRSGENAELNLNTTSAALVGRLRVGCGNSINYIRSEGAKDLQVLTDGSERLRITSGGNVGIGTTSPARTLQIQATSASFGINNTGGDSLAIDPPSGGFAQIDVSGANALRFNTNGSERARIDSSGRLLVGTSSAREINSGNDPLFQVERAAGSAYVSSFTKHSADAFGPHAVLIKTRGTTVGSNTAVVSGDEIGSIDFMGTDGTNPEIGASITAFVDGTPGTNDMPGRLVFSTTRDGESSPSQALIIENGQQSLFTTSTNARSTTGWYGVQVDPTVGAINVSRNGSNVMAFFHTSNASGVSGSPVGTISITTTATAYNTSSDYRLKENVTAVTDGITRLQQLKPSRFNFIADPAKTVDGFLAHEVQAIVPEAITGEKDAVDAEGNPIYQGIDQSKLVPLLTAALQEAIAKIESLEARLTAAGI